MGYGDCAETLKCISGSGVLEDTMGDEVSMEQVAQLTLMQTHLRASRSRSS